MSKKRIIFQVNIPYELESKLYKFCNDSVARYCEKNGFDHFILREAKMKISPDMERTGRNKDGLLKKAKNTLPIFEKEYGFNYLKEYDQVAIIDSDIYIRENAPNVFEELEDDYCFGGVLERDLPMTGAHHKKAKGYSRDMFDRLNDVKWEYKKDVADYMNMGMIVMNNSIVKYFSGQTPTEFIRRPEFKDLVDGMGLWRYSTDQVLLNYWLKKDGVPTKHMDWRWNTLYRGAEDKYLKEGYFIHFFLKNQINKKGEDINAIKKILNL